MKNNNNVSEVRAAMAIVAVPFKKYMDGFTKATDSYKERQRAYNDALKVVKDGASASMVDGGKGRLTVSVLRPDKHRVAINGGVKEGSVFHEIAEQDREAKASLFFESRKAKLTPDESGITEKDYIAIAKHNGLIPLGYREPNANGSLVYTKESCAKWIKEHTKAILAARQAVADEILAGMKAAASQAPAPVTLEVVKREKKAVKAA